MRKRLTWTSHQKEKLSKVVEILEELVDYKPLTLRQIFYQLVAKEYIENTVSQYGMLSNLLKWARIDGHISWLDVEDRVRAFHDARGWRNSRDFLEMALPSVIHQYRRDLWQTQERYVEVWVEKDALSSLFTRFCAPFGVSVAVCRGFSSVSFLKDFARRIARRRVTEPVMLYFGDFDPSGVEMLKAMETTLREEMKVDSLEFKRVALVRDDIFEYRLPHNPNALKQSDTRAKKHIEVYGELAVELDALRPDVLEAKVNQAVRAEISDLAAYERECDAFQRERSELEAFAGKALTLLEGGQR